MDIAKTDRRIRAVLLNGSRANQKISPDNLQDFDIHIVHQMILSYPAPPDIDFWGKLSPAFDGNGFPGADGEKASLISLFNASE